MSDIFKRAKNAPARPPVSEDFLPIAPDCPDVGHPKTLAEFANWCWDQIEWFRNFRTQLSVHGRMDSYAMRRLVEVVYLCNVFRKTHGGPAPEGFPQLTSLIDAREIGGSDFYDTPGNAYDEFAAIARDGNGGLRDELFGHDDESGRALFQALDDSEHFLSSAMQWAAGVQTTTPPKLIAHGNRSYSIDGVKPIVVTSEENSVLQAFATSKAAMTTKQLEKHVANVCRVMKRLDKRFPGAVLFPKRKGDGYYVNVCPHHVPTA